jgi:hypothetical protein
MYTRFCVIDSLCVDFFVLYNTVLRETISFLRTYATYGYLDGQITGMELLQSTVDALQKEVSTVQSAINDTLEIKMRRKIMELNLWLLTAFVLDFITLPPAQPSGRESMNRSSIFAPADILSGMPDFSLLVSSPTPSPMKRAVTAGKSMASVSSDQSYEAAPRPRNKSVDVFSPNKSFSEISASDFGDLASLDLNGSFTFKIDASKLDGGKPFSPDLSRIEQGRRDRRSSAMHRSSKHNAKKWKLVDSLLELLGPIGSNTWQSIDRVERVKAAIKVGYRLGRFAMHLMQESVDSIIVQPTSTPLTPLKNSTAPSARGDKGSLLLRAIDGTYWIILRVLLDLFVQSPFPDRELQEGGPRPVAMRAIERLQKQLEWIKDVSREYYDQEALFIVIKLADVLHSGKQPITSAWSKEALTTLTGLLSQQRDRLRDRLGGIAKASSPDGSSDHVGVERSSWVGSTSTDDDVMSPRSSFTSASEAMRASMDERPILKTTGSLDELDSAPVDAATVVMDAINQSLKLRDELALTWSKWNEITEPIMREALKAEKEMLATKLNVMGLHKDSQESTRQLEEARRTEEMQMAMFNHRLEELETKTRSMDVKRTRELVRAMEARRKRYKASWSSVNDELSNERGPWGGGALDSADVRHAIRCLVSATFHADCWVIAFNVYRRVCGWWTPAKTTAA